jgi:DNA-directed RNA polymerase specialized sigma subunit
LEDYPYSSYHHFLTQELPECLANAWIVKMTQGDRETIKDLLTAPVDTKELTEMTKASSLIEAPAQKNSPDIKKLEKMLRGFSGIEERNKQIVKAYEQGYSQHMIAKVLGISQPAVHGVIKREGGCV